jgi:hypothetical protein
MIPAAAVFAVAVLIALSPQALAQQPSQNESQVTESSTQEAPKVADANAESSAEKTPKENVDVKAKKEKAAKSEKVCWQERSLGSPMLKKVCRTKEEVAATEKSAKGAIRDMRRTTGSERGN